jgi:hypothetical protein
MRKPILVIAFLVAVGSDASAQEFTGNPRLVRRPTRTYTCLDLYRLRTRS